MPDTVATLVQLSSILRRGRGSSGLELVTGLPSGPNAEHRQFQIGIKDLPVHSKLRQVLQ